VRFLTNATNQRALAKVGALVPPVIAAADGVTSPQMQKVRELVANANYYQLYYDEFFTASVGTALDDMSQELFAGTKTPLQFAQGLDAAVAATV
jgi:hypothetical protein